MRPRPIVCALLAIATLACNRSSARPIQPKHSDVLIVLPNARNITWTATYDGSVTYLLDVPYPALDATLPLTHHFEAMGWQARPEDWLNPGDPVNQTWRSMIRSRNPNQRLHLWSTQWQNASGDVVNCSVTYEHPTRGGEPDPPSATEPATVEMIYFSADTVKRMQRAAASFR